jgi:N-glycosylase/DNA lyase
VKDIHREVKDGEIYIKGLEAFNLKAMMECGQAFRWETEGGKEYTGIVRGMVIKVRQEGDTLIFRTSGGHESISFWLDYFDIDRDYAGLERELVKDETIAPAVIFSSGNRIMRQDPWECMMSFIISANNSIPLIKRVIENLSRKYGRPIDFEGETYYSFPDSKTLAGVPVEGLSECRCGYRAKYLKRTAEIVADMGNGLESLRELNTESAREELMKFPGVGPKVANCILLFSLQKYDAFPVDIWIKRIMEHLFFEGRETPVNKIQKAAGQRFGSRAGFVQQYLFYYAREKWDEISSKEPGKI